MRRTRSAGCDRAQSETIGTVLLVGVFVILVTIVGVVVLGGIDTEADPLADLRVDGNATHIVITHRGGDSVPGEEVTVVLNGGSDTRRYTVDSANVTGDDGEFGFGDVFARLHGLSGPSATVRVVHGPSNTVLTEADVALESDAETDYAPAAAVSVSPANPSVGESATFDASGSNDPDGTIVEYAWDFDGDGTTDETTSSASVAHTYTSGGTYTATVTVTDDDGESGTASETVSVSSSAPTAAFSYTPSDPDPGESVTFDGSGSSDPDGTVAQYAWDWDDDGTYEQTGSSATATHTFASSGDYDVTLRVTDDAGRTGTTTQTVTVNTAPSASFTYSPSDPDTGESIAFDASGTSDPDGSIQTYEWDFNGDGTYEETGSSPTTSTTYGSNGDYDVTLRVTDDLGEQTTTTQTVTVNTPPTASFTTTVDDTDGDGALEIVYDASASADPDGTIATYRWDWDGDGTYEGSSSDPVYVVDDGSIYGFCPCAGSVTLEVEDGDGATAQQTNTDSERPEGFVTPGFELFGALLAVLLGGLLRRRGHV